MKKKSFVLVEALISLSLMTGAGMLFIHHFQQQYEQQKNLEEILLVEDHLQQKVQHPTHSIKISPWQAPVYYKKEKNTAKVWVTIHGKTYQHKVRFHPSRDAH